MTGWIPTLEKAAAQAQFIRSWSAAVLCRVVVNSSQTFLHYLGGWPGGELLFSFVRKKSAGVLCLPRWRNWSARRIERRRRKTANGNQRAAPFPGATELTWKWAALLFRPPLEPRHFPNPRPGLSCY